MATAFVTGGTGFVGRHVVAGLRTAGWHVRVLVRRSTLPSTYGEELVESPGGLSDAAALARGSEGADCVVHLAGRAHRRPSEPGDAQAHMDVNVGGTVAVATAAREAAVRRVIFVSSIAARGSESPASPAPSDAGLAPTPYGASKLAAERALAAHLTGTATSFVVLRPPLIYGAGMRGNPLRLFDAVSSGIPLPLGGIHNRRGMLYVGNLVDAIQRVLSAATAASRRYEVCDAEVSSTTEFIERIGRALHRPARLFHVPAAALRMFGAIGDQVDRLVDSPITSPQVAGLLDSLVLDGSPIARECGFVPCISLDDGLAATAAWHRHGKPPIDTAAEFTAPLSTAR